MGRLTLSKLEILFSGEAKKELLQYHHLIGKPERGGVLLGELYPQKNFALIKHIVEAPSKQKGFASYEMDVSFVQKRINTLWEQSGKTITYLGDWHSHPEKRPIPSVRDYITFSQNYFKSKIDQNFLVYIVTGFQDKGHVPLWIGICEGIRTKTHFNLY